MASSEQITSKAKTVSVEYLTNPLAVFKEVARILRPDGYFIVTYSIRGLPRPHDDRYFPEFLFSDPVYSVWGRKQKETMQ